MRSKFKIFRAIVFILFVPFIIVNIVSFNNDLISISLKNLQNIFSFSWIIYDNGLKLYVSLITVVSLILFYWRWQTENQAQKIADINGFCEELRHNINLTEQFIDYDKHNFYTKIYTEISQMEKEKCLKYPSPCDFYFTFPDKYKEYTNLVNFKPTPTIDFKFLKLRNDFITSAISSKTYFSLNSQRIFLNIGHLNYSITRYNLNIEMFNNNTLAFTGLQQDYFLWLHFRLHFILIDLILCIDSGIFIDKKYINEIKGYITTK
jgi:hypothetical protein